MELTEHNRFLIKQAVVDIILKNSSRKKIKHITCKIFWSSKLY